MAAAPRPLPLRRLADFVSGVGALPDTGQLAAYIQRLRSHGFDASPILRKFLACGAALTEDLVRIWGPGHRVLTCMTCVMHACLLKSEFLRNLC